MAERDLDVVVDGLGLAEAIGSLRDELLRARVAGVGSEIQLPIESMTVQLTVTATRTHEGRAGFRVPIVDLELGGSGSRLRGSEQLVTVVFGGPVDRSGRPVKVVSAAEKLEGLVVGAVGVSLAGRGSDCRSWVGSFPAVRLWLGLSGGGTDRVDRRARGRGCG